MTAELIKQHLDAKATIIDALHKFGDDNGHCPAYDQILERAGVPGRPGYVADRKDQGYAPLSVVGEGTAEEFDAWKASVSIALMSEARERGYTMVWVEARLREVGLPGRDVAVHARLEGTFSIPVDVTTIKGGNLIDHFNTTDALRQVKYNWDTSNVTWKLIVDPGRSDHEDGVGG